MSLKWVTCLSVYSAHAAIVAVVLGLTTVLVSADPIAHGRALIEVNCARCHAVGKQT